MLSDGCRISPIAECVNKHVAAHATHNWYLASAIPRIATARLHQTGRGRRPPSTSAKLPSALSRNLLECRVAAGEPLVCQYFDRDTACPLGTGDHVDDGVGHYVLVGLTADEPTADGSTVDVSVTFALLRRFHKTNTQIRNTQIRIRRMMLPTATPTITPVLSLGLAGGADVFVVVFAVVFAVGGAPPAGHGNPHHWKHTCSMHDVSSSKQ